MKTHTFGTAITWNLFGSIARVLITLVCQLTLLRLLGPLVAGHFAIFLVIVGAGSILSEGGMMVALVRRADLDDRVIRNALFLILCYATLTAAILLACTGPFMRLFRLPPTESYIPVMATLNVVPLALTSVPLSLLKRRYRSRDIQAIQLGAYVLGFALVAAPLALMMQSVIVMVVAFSVQTIVTLVGAMIVSRCPIVPRWRGAAAIRNVSARALMINIVLYFNESAAGVLTAQGLGARAIGLYTTALNLVRLPTDVIVTTFHAPLLVSTARDDGGAETRMRFLSTLNALATTVFAVFVVVFLCGDRIVGPLLGAKWFDAGPVLSVVGLVMIVRLLSMLSGAVVWGHGRLTLDLVAQLAALAVILAGFALVRPDDVVAVGWIVFASFVVRLAIQLQGAMRACAISSGEIVRALIAPLAVTTAFMAPTYWIAERLMPDDRVVGLLAFGAIAALLLAVRTSVALVAPRYAWATLTVAMLRTLWRRRPGASPVPFVPHGPA